MCVRGRWWRCRRAANAPRAIFKSHFTLLRVKRPDTALCEKRRRGGERAGEDGRSSEGRDVRDGKEMMVKTALKVEEESEGHDVGEEESNGCWH